MRGLALEQEVAEAVATLGYARIDQRFTAVAAAWDVADAAIAQLDRDLEVVGEFVIPPADGPPSRDFQTLHFDFGLPLDPAAPANVARYTALHVDAATPEATAATRLVELAPLLQAQAWPDERLLVDRLVRYGRTHGAFDDAAGYHEGSLARIVEAALGHELELPSVKTDPGFLCGTEFADIDAEVGFFRRRGLDLEGLEIDVVIEPGGLLIFDNLRVAHGRRGARMPGELHQRVYGEQAAPVDRQLAIRQALLAGFSSGR